MEPSLLCDHLCLGACDLGLFGGKPYEWNCRECIAAGENNPNYAAILRRAHEATHPPSQAPVSGCCDPITT